MGIVLVIIMALLLVVAIVTMGRSYFSSFVADRTTKGAFGDLALELAGNALTESHFRLAKLVNSPDNGGNLFKVFRSNFSKFSTEIPLSSLPAFREDLQRCKGFSLSDGEVNVEVLFQAPLSKHLPQYYDRFGTVRLSAEVAHNGIGVVRHLQESYDFKINLMTTPRFFDTYTFFVADAVFLVNAFSKDNNANKTIDDTLERIKELGEKLDFFILKIDEAITNAEEAKSNALADISQQYSSAIDNLKKSKIILTATRQNWPIVKVRDFGIQTSLSPDSLHYFPQPPFAVYSYEKNIDMNSLNLPEKIKNRMTKLDEAEKLLKEAAEACHAFIKPKPSNLDPFPGLIQGFCSASMAAGKEYESLLIEDYKAFQDSLIEIGGSSYDKFLPFFRQFRKDDMANKATAIITEVDNTGSGDTRTINEKFDALLSRHEAFTGVLYVNNPTQELVINREFKGRLVLLVDSDVVINRATLADPLQDMLTIVAFKTMKIQGPVEASLVPWLSFSCSSSAPITGNLIFSRLNFTSSPPSETLCFQLIRDERIQAGAAKLYPDYQHVCFGPTPNFTKIVRH